MIDPDLEGSVRKALAQFLPKELITDEMVQERVKAAAPLENPPTGPLEVEFMESISGTQIPVHSTTVEFGPGCCLADMIKIPSTITAKFGVIETLN